jgi:hypothetical protein
VKLASISTTSPSTYWRVPLVTTLFLFSFFLSYLCLVSPCWLILCRLRPLSFPCGVLPLSSSFVLDSSHCHSHVPSYYCTHGYIYPRDSSGSHQDLSSCLPLTHVDIALALACVPSLSLLTSASVPLRASASPAYCLSLPLQLLSL